MLPGAGLIRAEHFRKTTGFRPDLIVNEDWEMWCRLALIGEFLYIGKEPVLEYRIRLGSILRTIELYQGLFQSLRCIDAVFSLPGIQQKFSEQELAQLRRKREAAAFAATASKALLKRQWQPARHDLLESLRRHPCRPREIVLLSFAVMRWLPFALECRLR